MHSDNFAYFEKWCASKSLEERLLYNIQDSTQLQEVFLCPLL